MLFKSNDGTEKGEQIHRELIENEEKWKTRAKLIASQSKSLRTTTEMKIEFDSNKKSIKCQRRRVKWQTII